MYVKAEIKPAQVQNIFYIIYNVIFPHERYSKCVLAQEVWPDFDFPKLV